MVLGHLKDFCTLDIWLGTSGVYKTQVTNRYKKLLKLYKSQNFDDSEELQQKALCRAENIEIAKNNLLETLFHKNYYIAVSGEKYDFIHLNGDRWDKQNKARAKFYQAKTISREKNYSEAIIALKEAIIIDSCLKKAYLGLFITYIQTGNLIKALWWLWLFIR